MEKAPASMLQARLRQPNHTMLAIEWERSGLRCSGSSGDFLPAYIGPSEPDANAFRPIGYKSVCIERLRRMTGALGTFKKSRLATFKSTSPSRNPSTMHPPSFLMSHEELATLWHPSTEAAQAERMQASKFTEVQPEPRGICLHCHVTTDAIDELHV